MEDIKVLHLTRKVNIMKNLERFHICMYVCIYIYIYIYNETKLDYQINDKCTVKYNVTFDTLIHKTVLRCNFLYLSGPCSVTTC
jgi:hypothetical protein